LRVNDDLIKSKNSQYVFAVKPAALHAPLWLYRTVAVA